MGQPAGGRLRDADRLGLLDDDVLQVHDVAPFKCSEVRLDSTEAVLLLADGLLDLGSPQPQHSAKLLDRDVLREDLSDLLQAEADVAQGHECAASSPIPRRSRLNASQRPEHFAAEGGRGALVALDCL
jgi:hypothetical protein